MEKTRKRLVSEAQTIMIDAYMGGASKKEAFCLAFPDRAGRVKKPANAANFEFARPEVVDEINRRRTAQEEAMKEAAMSEAERVTALWSREDSVKRLIDIADDCQARRKAEDEDGSLLMDRDSIAAARLEKETVEALNKMLGYDAPVRVDADQNIVVKFAGIEDGEDWTA